MNNNHLLRKGAYALNNPITLLKKSLRSSLLYKLAFWIIFLTSLFAKSFYFQFTSNINARPFSDRLNIYMYMSTLGSLLLLSAIVFIVFNKRRYLALLVFHLVLTLLFLADTIYFRYFYHPISVTVLYQIGVVDSIGGSTLSLFKLKDLIFVVDLPFIILCYVILRRKGVEKLKLIKRSIISLAILAVAVFSIFTAYNRAYKPSFSIDTNYVAKYLGNLAFHYYDAKSFISEKLFEDNTLSEEEKKQIMDYYSAKANTNKKYKGIAEGKNLIIIQVEALQEFLINKKFNGKEITPNLNKLIQESAYFNNLYYQIGDGNTSDAEFLVNTSMYPLKSGSVNFRYPGNKYSSIPGILKEKGYDTLVFHANRPSFWNRSVMYKSLGFNTFHSNASYVQDEKVGWGLSDSSFFKQSISKIDINKPFYGLFITLSSHFPYNFDYSSRSKLDPGEYKDSILGKYMIAQNYSDACIGEFIDELKAKGIYDKSVIVIYGDHYAIPKHDTDDFDKFLDIQYTDLNWTKIQKVPLIVHYPGVENGKVIDTTGGEIDIMPTIANLMGFEAPYAIGKDLFNTDTGYALLRNGSLVTDKYVYLSNTSKAYDISTGLECTEETYKAELEKYLKEYEISQLIVEKDALKSLP